MTDRRSILAGMAGVAASGLAPLRASASSSALARGQDLLVLNARVITMDPRRPEAEAVYIRAGRIAYVGDRAEAIARAGEAPRLDAQGRTVIPGIIDGHTHIEWFSESMTYQTPIARTAPSLAAMFDILRGVAAKTPKGRWVMGRGDFNIREQVAEKRMPTRQEMDAISTEHPVALFSSIHVVSLNTMAFKKFGLFTQADQDKLRWRDGTPRNGSLVHRGPDGLPTGVMTEPGDLIYDQPLYTLEETKAAIRACAVPDFVSKGITSVVDIPSKAQHVRACMDMQAAGDLPLRMRWFYRTPGSIALSSQVDMGYRSGVGDDMARYGGVKVFIDGAGTDGVGNRIEDYKFTEEALTEVLTTCNRNGLQMIMHVVSPGGLKRCLTAVAAAERAAPAGIRHRIDHLGFLRNPDDIAAIRRLGLGIGFTRASKGTGVARPAPDYRAVLDAGIPMAVVSDSAGSFRDFSPFAGIGSLVAPVSEGGVLPDDRRLTLHEALAGWTSGSAHSMYEEADKGSITPGKLGDLVVLTADPRTAEPGALFDIRAQHVVLGGKPVYQRA